MIYPAQSNGGFKKQIKRSVDLTVAHASTYDTLPFDAGKTMKVITSAFQNRV